MKTAIQYEKEIEEKQSMIALLKRELTKALEALANKKDAKSLTVP
jgi:hypothetical protein